MSLLNCALVQYFPDFLGEEEAKRYFDRFREELQWADRTAGAGKLNRMTVVYGDPSLADCRPPAFWGDGAQILPWTAELCELKSRVEARTGCTYNICLGNRYAKPSHSLNWHAEIAGPFPELGSCQVSETKNLARRRASPA